MKHCKALAFIFILFCTVAKADLMLEIDYSPPSDVLLYSPLPVAVTITNSGPEAVLVPVQASLLRGITFEVEDASTGVAYPALEEGDRVGTKVAWLKPNGKYSFFEDLGWGLSVEGSYKITAVLRSNGRCPLRIVGSKEYPLIKLSSPDERAVYQCWAGEVRSSPIFINVQGPKTAPDLQALEYIEKVSSHTGMPERMFVAYPYLKEHFGTSAYVLISSFFVSPESSYAHSKQALESPLGKYLHQYARMKLALNSISKRQAVSRDITASLPSAIQRYLVQVESEKSSSARE